MATREVPRSTSEVVTIANETEVVTLKLRKPKTDKKIKWSQDTVDNENMGKKKSKCCCIYSKPKMFGESSSDESDSNDDETDHCRGHKGKCYQSSGHKSHGEDKSQ